MFKEIIVTGPIVDDADESKYSAYSPAGNLLFLRLCNALSTNDIAIKCILSVRPVKSWRLRNGEKLFYAKRQTKLVGIDTICLGFFNFGFIKTITHGIGTLYYLFKLSRRTPRDERVILCLSNLAPHGIFLQLAQRVLGFRSIAFIADIGSPHACSRIRRIDQFFQIRHYRTCSGLLVLHPDMPKDFGMRAPALTVPGSLDQATIETIDKNRLSGSSSRNKNPLKHDKGLIRFLYMGNLDHERGVLTLVDAFDAVVRDGAANNIELIIAGPDNCRFSDYHKDKIGIRYLGKLPYKDALKLYSEADFLVNPHPTDLKIAGYHFPSKVLEYMATGIPVISTDYSGIGGYFSDCMIIAKDGSVQSIKGALVEAIKLTKAERAAMGEKARSVIVSEYNWDCMGKKVARFLKDEI